MGFLNFKKRKDDTIDLGEKYFRNQEKLKEMRENLEESNKKESSQNPSPFNFFENIANSTKQNDSYKELNPSDSDVNERKRKLAKRLMDITEKLEDLSNQIYKLQQRIESLERKNRRDFN